MSRDPVVGLVASEPISDPVLLAAIGAAGLECVPVRPERGRLATFRQLLGCDVLLKSFGAYSPGFFRLFAAARAARRRVVLYWIGSDVLQAGGPYRAWARRVQWVVDGNLTVTEALREELAAQGVSAEVIPIVGDLRALEVVPLPDRFTVLTYLPAHDHLFYGSEAVLELARRRPETEFLVVGGEAGLRPLPNVTHLGFVSDMAPVYRRSSVLLRLTPHDGLPKMVLEALALGRRVIWNQEFPHCLLAGDVESAHRALDAMAPCREPQAAAAAFVQAHYDASAVAARLGEYLRRVARG